MRAAGLTAPSWETQSGGFGKSEARDLLSATKSEMSQRLRDVIRIAPRLKRSPGRYAFNVRFYGASEVAASDCFEAARPDIATSDSMSLYLHYPFCNYLCRFCHYAVASSAVADRFPLESLLQQNLRLLLRELPDVTLVPISSVYFGGGTPSVGSSEQRNRLVNQLRQIFKVKDDAEWAIEANPEAVTTRFLSDLMDSGFNRLSVGVQILDDAILGQLGRRHSVKQVTDALEVLLDRWKAPFNVDLIYGLPGVGPEKILEDLGTLIDLQVPSITLYRLRLSRTDERPSALQQVYDENPSLFPNQEQTVVQIAAARRLLRGFGYREGPVGWFVRGVVESQCYKDRWLAQRPLMGVGMSAYSYGHNWQFSLTRRLHKWASSLDRGVLPVNRAVVLSEEQSLARAVAFDLRYSGFMQNSRGIRGQLQDHVGASLRRIGLCEQGTEDYRLNELGLALIDEVLEEFLFSEQASF